MDSTSNQSDAQRDPQAPCFDDQASRLAELGSLASMLAHEINNLLTRAQGRVQLALRDPANARSRNTRRSLDFPADPHRETLEQVLDTLRQTTRLTDSMMRYASPAPKLESESTPATDVREAHDTAWGLLAPHHRSAKDQTPIEYETTWNTAGYEAGIDPVSLEQILLNLYLNAEGAIRTQRTLDPNAPGLVMISSALECSTWNTPIIRITVQDTGVGIAPADLQTIFEPWKQGDMIADRKKGFGLGLAVCQKLITEAGGTISCDSAPGIGSRFTIILPAIESESEKQQGPGGLAA